MSDDEGRAGAIIALRAAGAVFSLVFGSLARGDHRDNSDLDIAAWWLLDGPHSWDVAVPDGVDLVVLNDAPLELAGRIALQGTLLFDDDPPARVHRVADTRKIWLDERPRFERAHREGRVARLLRGISERTARLRSAYGADPAERGDLWLDSIKYLLVTTIESCVDVAQHVASSDDFGAPGISTRTSTTRLCLQRPIASASSMISSRR